MKRFLLLSALSLLGTSVAACSGSVDGDALDLDGSSDPDGGLVLDGGQFGDGLSAEVPLEDGHIDPDSACAAAAFDAKRIPPNLYLVFDHSGSMKETVTGGTKWSGSLAAINALVDKSEDTLKVGLKLFPLLADAKSCDAAAYAVPDVAVGPLATTRAPIKSVLAGASPNGNTPMAVALSSAVGYMHGLTTDGTRVVVLITDGDPNGCGTLADVIAAANGGRTGPAPQVLTYVIGAPGGTVQNLSQVAAAGGGKRTPTCIPSTTDPTKACHYQIGDATFEKDLLLALEDIKGKILSCTFDVPAASADAGTVDPNKVNVDFTDGSGTHTLDKDPTHTSGWDYTDGGKTITVYGVDCDKLKSDPTVKVQLVFGCKTKGPS